MSCWFCVLFVFWLASICWKVCLSTRWEDKRKGKKCKGRFGGIVAGEDLFDFLVKLREGSDEWELEDSVDGSDFVG